MDQTQQFKSDLSNFLQIIKNTTNLSEIKKEYVNLVKKYHPDTAPAQLKQKYNEYMIIFIYLNFFYSCFALRICFVDYDHVFVVFLL